MRFQIRRNSEWGEKFRELPTNGVSCCPAAFFAVIMKGKDFRDREGADLLLKRLTISRKMLVTFLPLALLPMLVLMFIAYDLFSSRMESYAGDQVHESVEQLARHADSYLDELERLSMLPYYQPEILKVMRERDDNDLLERYYSTVRVESLIAQSMINPREDLRDVFLYRTDGRLIFHSRYSVQLNEHYDFQEAFWYKKAMEGNGKAVFLGRYRDDRFVDPPDDVFSVTRLIKSYDQVVLGAILIDADFGSLAAMFDAVHLGRDANLVVLDQDHQLLYRQNDQHLDAVTRVLAAGEERLELAEGVYAVQSQSALTGWTFIGLIPVAELNNDILTMRNMIVMLSLLVAVGIVGATVFISRKITKPLQRLKMLIKEVQRGNFDVADPKPGSGEDEVGSVVSAFMNMSSQIKALIHQLSEVKVKQKEAELKQLKAQIEPHFLYNTLESIRALAELKDHYEIAEVTSSLGNLLRYSIASHDGLVQIGDELKQAQNYIVIQKICSQSPIRFILDIEEKILNAYTIPLLFQPIVENAIKHGFGGSGKGGEIVVSAHRSGDDVLVQISDNGKGMPAADVATLNEALARATQLDGQGEHKGLGIGLINVSARLQLVFGEPYGMMVHSDLNEGTTVLMRLPYIWDPTESQYHILHEGGVG